MEFFKPWPVLKKARGILFIKNQNGRGSETAFVLFETEFIASNALSKFGEWIRHRFIRLFRSNAAEANRVSRINAFLYFYLHIFV